MHKKVRDNSSQERSSHIAFRRYDDCTKGWKFGVVLIIILLRISFVVLATPLNDIRKEHDRAARIFHAGSCL